MPEQTMNIDPEYRALVLAKYGELIRAMMDFFGVIYHFEGRVNETVDCMTKNERDQAFDYFRANAKELGPWFRAFYHARKREREVKKREAKG